MPTVLVVDDDRTVTHLVERGLSEASISVVTAKSAEEGLSLVRSARPDVVLLDIMLPGATGLDVFHKPQEVDRRLPVIFITAGAGSETAIQAMQLGAYDYVAKPLDVAQLRSLVSKALETRRMMSVPVALLESELFGHEKGSFTGADRRRIGKFEQCNGGTLFLDEVGDMSPLVQGKVLRLLQEQRFERVGGNETIQTNVRLIAATNRNPETLMADGRFRQDLYYRLSVFTIRLPPLRERTGDLPLLAGYFLRRFAREM